MGIILKPKLVKIHSVLYLIWSTATENIRNEIQQNLEQQEFELFRGHLYMVFFSPQKITVLHDEWWTESGCRTMDMEDQLLI